MHKSLFQVNSTDKCRILYPGAKHCLHMEVEGIARKVLEDEADWIDRQLLTAKEEPEENGF